MDAGLAPRYIALVNTEGTMSVEELRAMWRIAHDKMLEAQDEEAQCWLRWRQAELERANAARDEGELE